MLVFQLLLSGSNFNQELLRLSMLTSAMSEIRVSGVPENENCRILL